MENELDTKYFSSKDKEKSDVIIYFRHAKFTFTMTNFTFITPAKVVEKTSAFDTLF